MHTYTFKNDTFFPTSKSPIKVTVFERSPFLKYDLCDQQQLFIHAYVS